MFQWIYSRWASSSSKGSFFLGAAFETSSSCRGTLWCCWKRGTCCWDSQKWIKKEVKEVVLCQPSRIRVWLFQNCLIFKYICSFFLGRGGKGGYKCPCGHVPVTMGCGLSLVLWSFLAGPGSDTLCAVQCSLWSWPRKITLFYFTGCWLALPKKVRGKNNY